MVEAPERIWAFLYTGSRVKGEFETTSISWGTEYVRADRIEALERQLAEALEKLAAQEAVKADWRDECQRQRQDRNTAEAERDRLAADNARLREALAKIAGTRMKSRPDVDIARAALAGKE